MVCDPLTGNTDVLLSHFWVIPRVNWLFPRTTFRSTLKTITRGHIASGSWHILHAQIIPRLGAGLVHTQSCGSVSSNMSTSFLTKTYAITAHGAIGGSAALVVTLASGEKTKLHTPRCESRWHLTMRAHGTILEGKYVLTVFIACSSQFSRLVQVIKLRWNTCTTPITLQPRLIQKATRLVRRPPEPSSGCSRAPSSYMLNAAIVLQQDWCASTNSSSRVCDMPILPANAIGSSASVRCVNSGGSVNRHHAGLWQCVRAYQWDGIVLRTKTRTHLQYGNESEDPARQSLSDVRVLLTS